MSDFQSKIIEVKDLLTDVNSLLAAQKTALDATAESISKYGKGKLPSDFSAAQKESIKNAEKQTALQKQIEENAKKQTAAIQKLTKEELSYTQAVERGVKSKEREVLVNEKLNSAYNKLNNARAHAKNVLRDLIASETASNAEIRKAQKEFDTLDKKVRKADHAVGDFSKTVGNYKTALSGVTNLMGAFGIATGLFLAVDIGKNIYETTKQLQSMDLALKMVSGTQAEFATNQSFIKNLAEQYGIEVKGLTKNFTEFWVASKGKLEAEQIKGIFTSISKSVAVMGLSIEQQDSAFLALQQMMSKGTVQAEELKKQLGNALPGAMKAATMAYQALHPEMKVTEALFMAQMKAGKILSSELLPELAKQFEVLYGIENVQRAETLQANQERLANTWTEMVRHMNESDTKGIGSWFAFVLKGLTFLTKEADRFLNSWNSIGKNAVNSGKQEGKASFNKDISGAKSREEAVKIVDFAKKSARELLFSKQAELDSVNEYLKEHDQWSVKNVGKALTGIQLFQVRSANFRREELLKEKGFAEAKLKAASQYEQDILKGGGLKKSIVNAPSTESEKERKKRESAEKKAERDRLKAEKDAAKESEQLLKDKYDAELSNLEKRKELLSDHLDNARNFNGDEISDFKFGVEKKIKYSKQLFDAEIAIAELTHKEKTRIANKEIKDRKLTPEQGKDLIIPIDNELEKSKGNSLQSYLKENSDSYKEYFNELENATPKDWSSKTPTMWSKEQMEQAEKDTEKIKKLQEKVVEDIKNYIASFQVELGHNLGFDETADFFLKMDEDGRTMFDKLNLMADGSKEKQIATFQAIAESAQEMFNFIASASQANFDAEYSRLEKQKEVAIGFAGDSDSAKKKIEEDYEKRRKEIQRREFKAKQKIAMVNIAIDTAQAIAATIGKTGFFGIPLAAIVGALGAVQLAMVASQKMPEYWVGTNNAQAGLAWTQERGAEIVTDKRGNIKDFGSNNGAKLTMMEAGDKVYNAEQTKRLLFNEELNSIMTNNNILPSKIEINSNGMSASEMDAILSKHFSNIQTNHTTFDRNGFSSWSERNGNRTIQDSNRASRKGYSV